MKRVVKKLLALLLMYVLVMSSGSDVLAADVSQKDELKVNDDFKYVCEQIFAGNGKMFDSEGLDRTKKFLEQYKNAFIEKDYNEILERCFAEEIVEIDVERIIKPNVSTRSIMHPSYEKMKTYLVTQPKAPYKGKSWYFVVKASGTYGYQEATNEIFTFPDPTIGYSFVDLGAAFSGSVTSTTTSGVTINSSKNKASFSVKTTHVVSCPLPGLDYVTGTLGPFTHTSNFEISV